MEQCPIYSNAEESFKKSLDPDPEADVFQNLISSSLCTDTSAAKFREAPFSSFPRKVVNRQRDEQRDR